jgi:hypothetical protein
MSNPIKYSKARSIKKKYLSTKSDTSNNRKIYKQNQRKES